VLSCVVQSVFKVAEVAQTFVRCQTYSRNSWRVPLQDLGRIVSDPIIVQFCPVHEADGAVLLLHQQTA
jgi:hypothetical protein